MASNLVLSARGISKGELNNEPGKTRFLDVPDGEMPKPSHAVSTARWRDEVMRRAGDVDPDTGFREGDVLIFIHGYNNAWDDIMARHDLLQKRLRAAGFEGAVVSFDWPSNDVGINYLEDRSNAKKTALQLVTDGIVLLASLQRDQQRRKCRINIHLLGHSTGAYVIREAFADADDRQSVSLINWTVSQVALIGGDISSASLSADNVKSESIFRHTVRLTNYTNPNDSVLKLSNAKRVGLAPRVGRIGLPDDAPEMCVDIDCGRHWEGLNKNDSSAPGSFPHSWHFDNQHLIDDLAHTLKGDVDRWCVRTREVIDGKLHLRPVADGPDARL